MFWLHNITKVYSQKTENNKTEAKINTKPIKKNYPKYCESIIEFFLKMKKLIKQIMLTLEVKIYQMKIEKEKKNI